MKIKKGFIIKKMSEKDEFYVVVGVGEASKKLKGYLTLNESGYLIWKLLESGSSKDEIINKFLDEYEIDKETVCRDVDAIITKLKQIGALDD